MSFTNNMSRHELGLWLRLIRSQRWSRKQKHALVTSLGSIELAVNVQPTEADMIFSQQSMTIRHRRVKKGVPQSVIDEDLSAIQKGQISLITIFDSDYPDLLKHINDPPIALFALGDQSLLDHPKVAIVGSRNPSPVGAKVAASIAQNLAEAGLTVVSGMALGIDGLAHRSSLAARANTIAVLGSGIDVIYPSQNRHLYNDLVAHGLVLSEYPFGFKPTRFSFPDRNRLVSGLSLGVVVVEAAEKSGTLITARMALEQDRELMVVPGASVSHQYKGSHRLIQDGAALVTCAQDVLHELSPSLTHQMANYCSNFNNQGVEAKVSDSSRTIFNLLDYYSIDVDSLIQQSKLSHARVMESLLELEMDGLIASTAEGGYIKVM